VIQICRDHYGTNASVADAPFSSRFDEQDSFVIFDDVEVPYERVFCEGDLNVYNNLNQGVSPGNTLQQTAIRAMVKLEFAYDLCSSILKVSNSLARPDAAESWADIRLSVADPLGHPAAEERAHDWGAGRSSAPRPVGAALRDAGMDDAGEPDHPGHRFAQSAGTPSLALFENPEIGDMLRKYLPGSNGMSAEQRTASCARHGILRARRWAAVSNSMKCSI
jgi:aromatic ring hydroxylase